MEPSPRLSLLSRSLQIPLSCKLAFWLLGIFTWGWFTEEVDDNLSMEEEAIPESSMADVAVVVDVEDILELFDSCCRLTFFPG